MTSKKQIDLNLRNVSPYEEFAWVARPIEMSYGKALATGKIAYNEAQMKFRSKLTKVKRIINIYKHHGWD